MSISLQYSSLVNSFGMPSWMLETVDSHDFCSGTRNYKSGCCRKDMQIRLLHVMFAVQAGCLTHALLYGGASLQTLAPGIVTSLSRD